jgi:hypothetical protein
MCLPRPPAPTLFSCKEQQQQQQQQQQWLRLRQAFATEMWPPPLSYFVKMNASQNK